MNIRSIGGNFLHLCTFINSLIITPDIIVCSEAWLMNCNGFIDMQGYSYHSNNSQLNKADGVVVYIKEGLNETTHIENYGSLSTLSTIIKKDNKCLKISSVYRCQVINAQNFVNNIKDLIISNKKFNKHIVVGDTNINILDESNIGNEYLSNFAESGYLPYIKSITRPSKKDINNGPCIDHIFAKLDIYARAFKLEHFFTDHYPILLTVDIKCKELKDDFISSLNYNKLLKLCRLTNWNSIYDIDDVNKATNFLIKNITNIVNISTRLKRIRKIQKPRKNWINTDLM